MAEEKGSAGSDDQGAGKLPLILGFVSILTFTILFLCTEWLFDSSVLLNPITCVILIIVSLVPFVFMKIGKSIAKIGSIVAFVATLLLAFFLFYRRNKVTRLWITAREINAELEKKVMAYLSPSGVVILTGPNGTVPIAKNLAFMDVNKDELKKKVAARIQAGAKKAEKSKKDADAEPNYDTYVKDAEIMDKLKSTRLSGIQYQMILNLTVKASKQLADKATREKYGFVDLQ